MTALTTITGELPSFSAEKENLAPQPPKGKDLTSLFQSRCPAVAIAVQEITYEDLPQATSTPDPIPVRFEFTPSPLDDDEKAKMDAEGYHSPSTYEATYRYHDEVTSGARELKKKISHLDRETLEEDQLELKRSMLSGDCLMRTLECRKEIQRLQIVAITFDDKIIDLLQEEDPTNDEDESALIRSQMIEALRGQLHALKSIQNLERRISALNEAHSALLD